MTESEIFNVARKLPPEERGAYLSSACASDEQLRKRVEELLQAHSLQGGWDTDATVINDSNLTNPMWSDSSFIAEWSLFCDSSNESDSNRSDEDWKRLAAIGPYTLLSRLGRGGMGEVWMAEQSHPVRRQVALKIIRAGFGSKEILARFEVERQALALMNHPNIARILDAGTTEVGQPYFAMELVQGKRLTTYCDENCLSVDERLHLFIDICHGVQHAHQKGIIHRDLKPRNILVTVIDGKAVPKVIDFGLAKAMESTQRLSDHSLSTGVGQILGTLKYMSPEQAGLDSIDIDTRTDIYALGVILYELLTGSTPLDDLLMTGQVVLKILEIIREKDPVKPSSRLGNSTTEQVSAITKLRRTDSIRLNRILTGDLDWIVMKALEKDRTRRYETAYGFATDIRRYLNGETVTARPPSLGYRMRKFVGKNRVAVTAASFVSLFLIGGIVGTTLAMLRAMDAESVAAARLQEAHDAREAAGKQAERAEKAALAEKAANDQSRLRLRHIEKGSELLFSIFSDIDIHQIREEGKPVENVLAERLVKVSEQLEQGAIADRKTEADLLNRLGISLHGLGAHTEARKLFERAVTLRTKELGSKNRQTLESMRFLATAMRAEGDDDNSLLLAQKTLESQLEVLPPDDPDLLSTLNEIALHLSNQGKFKEAIELLRSIVSGAEKAYGTEHQDTLMAKSNLADAIRSSGNLRESLELHREVFETRQKVLGDSHIQTIRSSNQVASLLLLNGEIQEGIAGFRKSYSLAVESFGSEHPDTIKAMGFLATALESNGSPEESIALNRQVIKSLGLRKGPDDDDTLAATANLASALDRKGESLEAERLLRDVLERRTRVLGEDHPSTITVLGNLGSMITRAGRAAESLPLLEKNLKSCIQTLGEDHPLTSVARINLAVAMHQLKRFAEVEATAMEAVQRLVPTLGENHPYTRQAQTVLAAAYRATGQLTKAIPIYESSLSYYREKQGDRHPETLQQMNNFASALKDAGETDRAMEIWREAIIGMEEVLGPDHAQTLIATANLGVTCKSCNRLGEARPLLQRAHDASWKIRQLAPIGFHLLETVSRLGDREGTVRLGEELLARERKSSPDNSEVLRASLLKIAENYQAVEANTEAEALLREYVESAGEEERDAPDFLAAQFELGLSLARQGHQPEANVLFEAGIDGLMAREPMLAAKEAERARVALGRIIQHYTILENTSEVEKYRELRDKYLASEEPSKE